MKLYDMAGRNCGHFEGGEAPEGYWLRQNDAEDSMPSVYFLEKLGKDVLFAVWQVAQQNPDLLFQVCRGFSTQNILITESFPLLVLLEQEGILPQGTAIAVWS